MSDSIRPYQNYTGGLVPQAVLNGTINTIVYASNYNDLDNKPSINSVELRGNKTASDLGLATPEDITVTSVNTQTGDVSLTGQNIPYDTALSVTEKINDLESQIVDSGVTSVNGFTGVVNLTGNNIPYIVGKSVNTKINEVESSIPIVDYPVTSVNSKTGAVNLTGADIEYSAGVSISTQIDNVEGEISDLTGADIPMSGEDSTPVSTAIGSLSSLTTTNKDSLVDAVNEVDGAVGALNNPTELTISPYTGVTVTSKAYQITDRLICVNFEATFPTASNSWVNCFDIAWDTSFSTSNFGAVSDGGTNHTFIQAFWNTNKITIRLNSPRAVQYRGQVFVVVK